MIKVSFKSNFKINKVNDNDENHVCIGVFDSIKVKVEANNSFPIDLKCTILVTNDDCEEYSII